MSEEQPEEAKEEKFDDPLKDAKGARGPLLWAALLFIPIVLSMGVSLMRERPVAEVQDVEQAAVPVAQKAVQSSYKGRRRTVGMLCVFSEWEGRALDTALEVDLKALGRPYRVLLPDAMMTMDHNAARVNIDVDERGVITRVWCG